jgi:hypothetical protein
MDQVDVEVVGKKGLSDIEELMEIWPVGAWIREKDKVSEDPLGVSASDSRWTDVSGEFVAGTFRDPQAGGGGKICKSLHIIHTAAVLV